MSGIMKLSRQGVTWGLEPKLCPQRNVQFVCVEGNLIGVEVRNRKETSCVGSVRRIILFRNEFLGSPFNCGWRICRHWFVFFPVPGFLLQ